MKSSVSSDVGTLFIKNAKRYIKLEIEISSYLEPQDVENYGLVLLLEVAIADPIPNVLGRTAKKILSRFPSWMKMFIDAEDDATPSIQQPQTVAGNFINALVSDFPENFEKQVNLFELDRYITSSDLEQVSWIYISYDAPASLIEVRGDNVLLSKVDSIGSLYESLEEDYCYYYNPIDRQLFTKKLFKTLSVDSTIYVQTPTLKWNWFDEFAARVGIQRLYLEDNESLKNRTLDVYKNLPGNTLESIKKTLRRELNIWNALGATPDSNYLGATPEILEIKDLESSTPYFDFSGVPQEEFRKFVRELNEKYPVNWGYVKWGEGYWDYAGDDQSGVGRIPASYDGSTPLGEYYQPGIGDFNDAKIVVREPSETEVELNERFKAYGVSYVGTTDNYAPIKADYEYYGTYYQDYYDNNAATVNVRYVLHTNAHGSYVGNNDFYVDFSIYPVNQYGPSSSASPEYNIFNIFDQDGYALPEYIFKNVSTNAVYNNTAYNPALTRINYYNSYKASATPQSGSSNFFLQFNSATPDSYTSTVNSSISLASPSYSNGATNLKAVSKVYNKYRGNFETTPRIKGSVFLNTSNDINGIDDYELDKTFISNTLMFPPGATPEYVIIKNIKPEGYDADTALGMAEQYDGYGGISNYNYIDYYVPSSPNIIGQFITPNFATPSNHFGYINTVGSTVNYYFVELKYPYNSVPGTIKFTTGLSSTPVYPFKLDQWERFEELSTPMIEGVVNKNGVVISDPDNWDETFSKNSNIVGKYNLSYDTFGVSKENNWIQYIEVNNSQDGVSLSSNAQYVVVDGEDSQQQFLTNKIKEYSDGTFDPIIVSADFDGVYKSYINTGWYSYGEELNYIYSSPLTEIFATPGFDLSLTSVARQGAPIIVNRLYATPSQLKEVAFYDENNPLKVSLINTEIVRANRSNNLYFGYENIYDVNIIDNVTGYTIKQNAETISNYLEVFSQATPSVYDRNYTATYKVRDSYAVDNDVWNDDEEKYITKIYFDATPNEFYSYEITYESSINGSSTPIYLEVDPTKLWDEEGFVYLSHADYDFNTAEITLSPKFISDNYDDLMILTIISLDINGNPKPYQTFSITGNYVYSEQDYYTTDINGFASAVIRYNGTVPTTSTSGQITVSGLTNGSPNAHENSQTEGFYETIFHEITTVYESGLELKAVPQDYSINADGVSVNYINGILKLNGIPQANKIVYWRTGRTLYEIFEQVGYSNNVTTDQYGKFTIGPITSEHNNNPGIWFMVIDSENSGSVNLNPITETGDIIYWQEKYDNLNYQYGTGLLFGSNVLLGQNYDMYSTPNFTVSYYNGDYSAPYNVSPDWLPPKWYPLNRLDQYRMGLFGATPFVFDNYQDLMKDYEED